MIDELRCNGCGKKFAEIKDNKLRIVCSRCRRFHEFDIATLLQGYISHKLISIKKQSVV